MRWALVTAMLVVAVLVVALPAAAQDAPPSEAPPDAPATAEPPPAPPPAWVPGQAAQLLVLDKVSARATPVTIAVGAQVSLRSLTIAVRACDTRPPDRPADATAFLDITDSTPGAPAFHGWLVRSDPAVSGLEHPTYDVRLTGCA